MLPFNLFFQYYPVYYRNWTTLYINTHLYILSKFQMFTHLWSQLLVGVSIINPLSIHFSNYTSHFLPQNSDNDALSHKISYVFFSRNFFFVRQRRFLAMHVHSLCGALQTASVASCGINRLAAGNLDPTSRSILPVKFVSPPCTPDLLGICQTCVFIVFSLLRSNRTR